MTLRGTILDDAFEPLGLADWVFTLTPDEQAKAFRALDRMMAAPPWSALPYAPSGNVPDRSDEIGALEAHAEAIAANLSLRLAPGFGKMVSGEQRRIAREGLNRVIAATIVVPQDSRPALPFVCGGDWRFGIAR